VNEVDVYTQLTALDQRSSVSEHRIADLEDSQKQIYKLTSSVQELAFSIKSMAEEQARQSKEIARQAERVKCIEERPDKDKARIVDAIAKYVLTGVVSFVVAYIMFKATGFKF